MAMRGGSGSRAEEPLDLQGLRARTGETLGAGFFNDVRSLAVDKVLKLGKPYGPFSQPLSWLLRNRQEHRQVSPYLRVPATYHVRMRTEEGAPVSVILQGRLNGRVLSQLPDDELYGESLRDELHALETALHRCVREAGWLPDVIGGPPRWGMHDVRRSNNLFVDASGHIWLIDPGALFFWFSARNPIGKLYTALLIRSTRRMTRRSGRG